MSQASVKSAVASQPELHETKRFSQDKLKQVDALILGIVKKEIPLIYEISEHIIASGGKRLRPLLTLICAEIAGYSGTRHVGLAAAVEFIHTATLLHDDVVDESKLRRGLATANDVWDNKSSVLVGDFLLSQAFRLMVADGSIEVLDVLSNAAAVISKGEVLQITTEANAATTYDIYLSVIEAKTAELFAAACEIAPIIAGKSQSREIYRAYGYALGMAFQMMDDVLDYTAEVAELGKNLGDDFREKKMTLPLILALKAAQNDNQAQDFFARILSDAPVGDGDFETALNYMHQFGVFDEIRTYIYNYCDKAEAELKRMPEHPAKKCLFELIDFSRKRIY